MNLGQSLLVVAALSILGMLILQSNRTIMETNDIQNDSEFGITAVSLATSLVEESMGKMFDKAVADSNNTLLDSMLLTPTANLGPDPGESYRGHVAGTTDFDDFDDYNGLFLVFKSAVAADTAHTPGSTYEIIVPGIRSKYYVRTQVRYVPPTNLNNPTTGQTWHKRIRIKVTRPQANNKIDSLVFPAVMSFWN